MSTLSEEDLLRMSLTGQSPTSSSFDHEKSLGNHAFKQNHLSQAIHHYNNAEQINPLSPIPPANRAMAYLKLEHWKAAKDDATVALELYNALPHSNPDHSLPIKVLLRRATANSHLLLHALAADDYAHILRLDPAHAVAKQRLEQLHHKYNITPSPSASAANQATANSRKKIQLLSTDLSSNGTAHLPPPTPAHALHTMQDEAALVQLPSHVMRSLLTKWSGTAPVSSVDFERAWRSLRADDLARAAYLIQTVGASRIRSGLLGESLTPQLLNEFVHVLAVALKTDRACSTSVADIMEAFTTVSRFGMLLMFLSESESESIHSLIEGLGKNGVEAASVQKLHNLYSQG